MIVYLIDIVLIVVISTFVISGFKSGMIKSFLLMINSILSWIFSVYISKFVSYFVYSKFIKQSVVKEMDVLLKTKYLKQDIFINKLPKIIANSMPNYGITLDKITHIINNVSKEVLPNKLAEVFMPIIIEILEFFITGIVFITLLLLGKVLIRLILKLFKLKIINYSDKMFGGIFGALKGYIIILIFACILRVLVPFSFPTKIQKSISKTISSTIVFRPLYESNPLYTMFKKL